MREITVLITACGNAYMPGTCRALKENGEREIRLVGADMNYDDTILQMCDAYYTVPRADASNYVDVLLEICKKEKVDVLIPIMSAELETLAINREKFQTIGTMVSVSDYPSLCVANNKLALFEFLKREELPCPSFVPVKSIEDIDKAISILGYPVVFKTSEGSGSRGMRIIDPRKSRFDILFHEKPNSCYTTLEDFKSTLSEGDMPEMHGMEYLPGDEYTVDLLVEKGVVKYAMCRRGLNVQTSIILDGIVEDCPEICAMCSKVAERLGLSGNIGFDVKKRANGEPVIMECNPRATAGVSEFVASGVNLLYLCVKQCLGEPLPQIEPEYGIVMRRRYMEMYTRI